MRKQTSRYPDPFVYEDERWTWEGVTATCPKGWKSRMAYSLTNKGTYSRLILITSEGKKHIYRWRRSSVDVATLEARGFTVVKRRKPKRLSIR